jgi:hypothetical protein
MEFYNREKELGLIAETQNFAFKEHSWNVSKFS